MTSRPRFRIFVSYSHDWSEMAHAIVRYLRDVLQLDARCDSNLQPGQPFTDEIKEQISRAHVFMPLLTKDVRKRPWVNQEIGFALGLGVPILPLALGRLPGGMTQSLQAIWIRKNCRVRDDDGYRERDRCEARLKRALLELLPRERIEWLVELGRERPSASFEWASSLELRTEMIVRGARWVQSRSGPAMIRQAAVLGSLSLPDKPPDDKIWDRIEGQVASCDQGRQLLTQERLVLQEHAGRAGCKFVLFPWLNWELAGTERTVERIKVLIHGLGKVDAISGEQQKLVVVMDDGDPRVSPVAKSGLKPRNLLIIGDWFAAESAVRLRGTGYQQTIATWHALTVCSWLEEFDARFDQLRELHLSPVQAIKKLEQISQRMIDHAPLPPGD